MRQGNEKLAAVIVMFIIITVSAGFAGGTEGLLAWFSGEEAVVEEETQSGKGDATASNEADGDSSPEVEKEESSENQEPTTDEEFLAQEEIVKEEKIPYVDVEPADLSAGNLILVNKNYNLASDYIPEGLVGLSYTVHGSDRTKLLPDAAAAFDFLVEKAAEEGIELKATTAFRDYGFQNTLYTNYVANNGQELADTFSARPGHSEHQTGLAVDVSGPSVNFELVRELGEQPEGIWLAEHAAEFGFILRYFEGSEDITGYLYEPWHLRYVGTEHSKFIMSTGLTLEEYLGEVDSGGM